MLFIIRWQKYNFKNKTESVILKKISNKGYYKKQIFNKIGGFYIFLKRFCAWLNSFVNRSN